MDASIPSDLEQKLHEIVIAMPYPYAGYHKMRSRVAGSKKYVNFHLLICRDEKIDEAHKMADKLEIVLAKEINNLDTIIHIEPCTNPCDLSKETCLLRK